MESGPNLEKMIVPEQVAGLSDLEGTPSDSAVPESLEPITEVDSPRVFTDKEMENRERVFREIHFRNRKHRIDTENTARIINIRALSAIGLAAQNRVIRLQNIPRDQEEPH